MASFRDGKRNRPQTAHFTIHQTRVGTDDRAGRCIRSLEAVVASDTRVNHIIVGHDDPLPDPEQGVSLAYRRGLRRMTIHASRPLTWLPDFL